MNFLYHQVFKTRLAQGCRRVAGGFLALLCVVSVTAVPAFAEPVRINQVIQTISSSQGTPDLKLNSLITQQDPNGQNGSTQTGPRNDNAGTQAPKTDSITSGVVVTDEGQRLGVEVFEEAEVNGTICDCGEILIAGGGIPKWPFLFLAAVPLIFIHDCDDCDTPDTTPTPTPTPTSTPTPTPTPQVPEPASLMLLGTGLMAFGAGLRRRYSKKKAVEQIEEEE